MEKTLYAAIEGGGTKFICAVMDENRRILSQARFACTGPAETIAHCLGFLRQAQDSLGALKALGIACFGPLDPRPDSADYGKILATPKKGWAGTDMVRPFAEGLRVPVAFDTDVNGAVLAESLWGAGKGLKSVVYFTIGTGIGGGAILEKKPIHGLMHPEMGHMRIPHDQARDPFKGICPFHGDCFEGLASGPAIAARWGHKAEALPAGHPGWALEAHYIALAMQNVICTLMPQRVILGGGVMAQSHLFRLIRGKLLEALGGYLQIPAITSSMEEYLVPSPLEGIAGLYGALALAMSAG
ncbi:MAG: ROK family protein [Anaerolineaceae bacterium]|nr:ROK family protein [Anaerolineaceae bacterium]